MTSTSYKNIPIGTRFDRLVTGEFCGFDEKHRALFWTTCDCGTKLQTPGSSLRAGIIKSCGCLHKDRMSQLSASRSQDETGKRFGKLFVQRKLSETDGVFIYECICDCGSVTNVKGTALRSGSRENCGAWGCQEDMSAALVEKINPDDITKDAYFAGHFDGEGWVGFMAPARGLMPGVSIRVAGVYKPTILDYRSYFGGTVRITAHNSVARGHSSRLQWTWQLCGQVGVLRFLKRVLPFSKEKKLQLELAHDYLMERIESFKYGAEETLKAKIPELRARISKMKQFEFKN